ncbi:MAG: hypothetical protein A2Y24_03045 [Clostridiales bacterium GWE2_32_10]|nr:MAG: hypothetical protein A2Y24_03045 [Clostridiales bacterium GWE2_32_10]HBY20125.1 hypothetical protein [Clostridiales bacterium]
MNSFKDMILTRYDLPKKIDRTRAENFINYECKNEIERVWQLAFRDLREHDLSDISTDLFAKLTFSYDAVLNDKDSERIHIQNLIELARKNGFGIDELHEAGVYGKGMHIAVIDQGLQVHSKIFKENIIMHTDNISDEDSMHANAIVDVIHKIAPEAMIHFYESDYKNVVEDRLEKLEEIYEYNQCFKFDGKISVISISSGLLFDGIKQNEDQRKRAEKIIKLLEEDGCTVLSSEVFEKYFAIASPKYDEDYTKIVDWMYGEDWVTQKAETHKAVIDRKRENSILVPGGGRLYAIPGEVSYYVYCGSAAYSWSIPIVASMILLMKSKIPNISTQEFYELASECCNYTNEDWRIIDMDKMYDM